MHFKLVDAIGTNGSSGLRKLSSGLPADSAPAARRKPPFSDFLALIEKSCARPINVTQSVERRWGKEYLRFSADLVGFDRGKKGALLDYFSSKLSSEGTVSYSTGRGDFCWVKNQEKKPVELQERIGICHTAGGDARLHLVARVRKFEL